MTDAAGYFGAGGGGLLDTRSMRSPTRGSSWALDNRPWGERGGGGSRGRGVVSGGVVRMKIKPAAGMHRTEDSTGCRLPHSLQSECILPLPPLQPPAEGRGDRRGGGGRWNGLGEEGSSSEFVRVGEHPLQSLLLLTFMSAMHD